MNFIDRFAKFTAERGRPLLGLLAVLMVTAIVGMFRLRIETDFNIFMPVDSEKIRAVEAVDAAFGDAEQVLVLQTLGSRPTDPAGIQALLNVGKDLAAVDGVSRVQAPVPGAYAVGRTMRRTADLKPGDMSDLYAFMDTMMAGTGLIESKGIWYGTYQVLLDGSRHYRPLLKDLRAVLDQDGLDYVLSGEPYLETKIFDYVLKILLTLPPAAIILMLTVFRLRIGSFKGTILSLFPAIVGAALTMGGIGWFLRDISVVTVLVPIFVIVMGSADGLHFVSHVLDGLDQGGERSAVIGETLHAVGSPMVMTTLTTMAGFLSMLVINSTAIRTMGVIAAIGVGVAGIATWVFLPVVMNLIPGLERKRPRERDAVSRFLSRVQGPRAIVLAVVLLALAIPGVTLLKANFNMLTMYKDYTEVQKSIRRINDVMGAALPVTVLVQANNLEDPAVADAVLTLQKRAKEEGLASVSVSFYDVLSKAAGILTTAGEGYPTNRAMRNFLTRIMEERNPGMFSTFLSDGKDGGEPLGRAIFFLSDLQSETLSRFQVLVDESAGNGIRLETAGIPFVMKEMNDQIIPQQVMSLIAAGLAVLVMVALTQRSLRLGIFSAIPIALTLVVLYGTMGYARIDLSVVTGIMSGLTIGVGIDYAIHFSSMFRYFRRKADPDPVSTALRYVSAPVLANAMGLAIGFTAMSLSPLRIHVYLAVLMWVTMVISSVLSLTLLPTMIRWGEGLRTKRTGNAGV